MDTLVFLDPDNGFETRSQRGPKWMRHAEDPRVQRWRPIGTGRGGVGEGGGGALTADGRRLTEANLAFLVLSRARGSAERLSRAAIGYCEGTPGVRAAALSCDERGDRPTGGPGETTPGREVWFEDELLVG